VEPRPKKKFARGEREWGEANASGERRMRVGRGERKWNLKEVEREWEEPARERGSANRVRRLRVSVATLPATVGILFCTEMVCGYLAIRSWSTGPTLSHPQTLHIQPSLNGATGKHGNAGTETGTGTGTGTETGKHGNS